MLQNGDFVVARREDISDKSKNKAENLTYQVSEPFIITRPTSHGSHIPRKLRHKNN